MTAAQWDKYPNFTKSEFDCKHTGENNMQHEFMEVLQKIRKDYNKPMTITSGFRSVNHPIEKRKTHSNGEHTKGMCADVMCRKSQDRFLLIKCALEHGITRIGVSKTFLHFGLGGHGLPDCVIWDY